MSTVTRKLRILAITLVVGSVMVVGSAPAAHAGDDPAGAGVCIATLCL